MEERRVRIGSLFEWLAAAAAVTGLVWLGSAQMRGVLGPRLAAVIVEAPGGSPPGIPEGAVHVPVLMLLDGREIRSGELRSSLDGLLPETAAEGPAHTSSGEFGERHTRAYNVGGTRFYVVCEAHVPGSPHRVSGVWVP
ncbi:MAG: hypothetical protein ACT4QD_14910 [Acidobacteriota bacterium]